MEYFRTWFENQEVSSKADQLINQVKDFQSTAERPYPGAGLKESDPLDLAAVVAGRKPAAGISKEFLQTPLGKELIRRATEQGMTYSQGFGILGGEQGDFAVGHSKNVKSIIDAYKTINHLDGWKNEVRQGKLNSDQAQQVIDKLVQAHTIVGINLGFPPEAVKKFSDNMRNHFQQNLTKVLSN